jgi:hypothetical protein
MAPVKARIPLAWPASCLQLEAAGYKFESTRKCKLCPAVIEFWRRGKEVMPISRLEGGLRVSHFADCPEAPVFRKQKQDRKQKELFE